MRLSTSSVCIYVASSSVTYALRNSHITPQARIYKAFAGFICTYASPFYKPVTPCVPNSAERDLFASVCLMRKSPQDSNTKHFRDYKAVTKAGFIWRLRDYEPVSQWVIYEPVAPSEWYMSQLPQWVIYEPVAQCIIYAPLFRGVLSASLQTLQASPLYPQSFNPHNFPHNRPQQTFQPITSTNLHLSIHSPLELD